MTTLTDPPKEQFRLSIWGVVLGAEGHQIPHIHPSAWLSGVYYVRLPGAMDSPDREPAGYIEFGRPPAHFHFSSDPRVRLIRPLQGHMLLFPSYFYHRTEPFESNDTRISIAFDIIPTP